MGIDWGEGEGLEINWITKDPKGGGGGGIDRVFKLMNRWNGSIAFPKNEKKKKKHRKRDPKRILCRVINYTLILYNPKTLLKSSTR